ncbi:SoxR reducing system RseC family protein [Arenimonas sp.]|uniref:SoxR reducing system RseC family protein n=1 Tax=Arenimonas sp. TaxID=1872635 RepID=UPI0035ADC0B0
MAEREAEVVGASDRRLSLRLLGSACHGCAGGCGGRCSLFAGDGGGDFELEVDDVAGFPPGRRLRLRLDDQALRQAAWRGYGRVLAGLLAGAALGQGLGLAWGRHADLLTLLGLLSGTLLVARFSKPRLPRPEILAARAENHFDPEGRNRQ